MNNYDDLPLDKILKLLGKQHQMCEPEDPLAQLISQTMDSEGYLDEDELEYVQAARKTLAKADFAAWTKKVNAHE